ncbi:MAG: DUF177 domain-containing protein [Gemmatimonadales bacterium]
MVRLDLALLAAGPVETAAEVPADDPLFEDVDFILAAPVVVSGRLTASGPGRYYWDARLATTVATACRRCLARVDVQVESDLEALFSEDASLDDPASYLIPGGARELDLSQPIREELILAVPEYVLCREDCRGLCSRCGKDLNEGPCGCGSEPDPRWAALERLRVTPDTE